MHADLTRIGRWFVSGDSVLPLAMRYGNRLEPDRGRAVMNFEVRAGPALLRMWQALQILSLPQESSGKVHLPEALLCLQGESISEVRRRVWREPNPKRFNEGAILWSEP